MAISRMFVKLYAGAVLGGVACGTIWGLKVGFESANQTCFKQDKLTGFDYIAEVGCYSTIVLSGGILTGIVSGLIAATIVPTFPISLPILYKQFNEQCERNC